MNYNILKYLVSEGFKGVLKNKKSAFASLIIMYITLITVGLGIAGAKNVSSIVEQLEREFPIKVFIKDNISKDDLAYMEDSIRVIPYVNDVKYTSKAEAFKNKKEEMKGTADVMMLSYTETNNPFPADFTITLTDLSKSEEVVNELNKLDNVYMKDGKKYIVTKYDTITKLNKVKKGIKIMFIILGGLLVTGSVLIIGNTIKLAVNSRKREISIMKYVGATNNFIRAPFVVEGIVIGIIATAISLLTVGTLYSIIYKKSGGNLFSYQVLSFSDLFSTELIAFAILGIGIGVIGSIISMKKYLKV